MQLPTFDQAKALFKKIESLYHEGEDYQGAYLDGENVVIYSTTTKRGLISRFWDGYSLRAILMPPSTKNAIVARFFRLPVTERRAIAEKLELFTEEKLNGIDFHVASMDILLEAERQHKLNRLYSLLFPDRDNPWEA